MKVACLVSEYPAVSHTFIRREVVELRKRGLDVQTFSIRPPAQREWMSAADTAEYESTYYVLPPPKARLVGSHVKSCLQHPWRYLATAKKALEHRPPGVKGLVYSAFYFAEAIMLATELRKRGIEHVHNHFANAAATVGLLATQYLDLPWSFTIHGTSEFDYPAGLLLGDKIKAARFVACVSKFGRAQAQRCVDPKQWSKLFINRCGIDPSDLPTREPRDPKREASRIIAVTRLSREKAIPGLIEAFAAVSKRVPRARLDIIGDGPERPVVEALIASLHLGNSCKIWGYLSVEEVLREVAKSDILVMSSLMEGLPVVLMEALALEVAVVAPRVAGIPELVEHEQTGLLYTVSDWSQLAECLERLLQDADLRQQLAARGHERVLEQHAIGRAVMPIATQLLEQEKSRRAASPPDAP